MKRPTGSPWWLLGVLVVVLVATESIMTLGLHFFNLLGHHPHPFSQGAVTSLLDVLLMTAIAVPLVYLLLVRPLIREMDRRRNLQENMALFRETIDQSPDGIFVVDPETAEILDVNETAQEMLGYYREELTGKRVQEINLTFDNEMDWASFNQRVREEGPVTVEARHETREGDTIPVQVKVDRVETIDGARHLAMARDLTEKKELERRHQRRRRRFEAIFHSSHSLVGLLEPDGTLLEANQSALDLIQEPLEAVQGKPFWETPWWTHSESLQEQVREAVNRASDGELVQFEATHPGPDGGTLDFDFSLTPIKNDRGEVEYLVPEGRDITRQKQLQQNLAEQRNFLETIINAANQGIFVKNWQGEYVIANETVANIYGTSRDQIEGRSDRAFVEDEIADKFLEHDRRVIENNEVIQEQEKVPHAGHGEMRDFLTVKAPVYEDRPPEERMVVGITTDITKRMTLRDQLKQQKDFLQTIIDSAPNMIFVKNWDGEFQLVNQSMADFFGVDRDTIVGQKEHEFLSKDKEVEKVYEDDREVLRTGEPKHIPEEYFQHPRTGDEVVFNTVKVPLDLDQDPENRRVLGIATEITEQVQLRREQERLTKIIHHSPDFIATAKPDGNHLYVNEKMRRVFDIDPDEDISKYTISDFHPDEVAEHILQEAIPVAREEGTWSGESTLLTPEGEEIPVLQLIMAHYDDEGDVRYYSTNMRDISDLKQYQEELRERERRFQQMTDVVNEIFWMFNDDISELIYVNEAKYEAIWGRDPARLEDNPLDFLEGIHPDDREQVRDAMERLRTGNDASIQIRVNRREDFERHVEIEGFPVRESDGTITRLAGTGRDITDRKEAERELRESEERFRQMAENIEEVFWVADPRPSGGVEYVSPAYEEIWGRPREELYEHPDRWQEAIVPEDRERVKEASEDQTGPVTYDIEYRIETPDGERRWIRDRAFPVENEDGEVTRITGLAEDITEIKRIQESLEASLREKNTLLQEVHHRVKNNMQIITSLLRMQAREIEDERIDRLVAESQQRVRSMALIHEKLYQSDDLARIRYDQYIRELVNGVVGSRVSSGTDVDVVFDLDEDAELSIDQAIPCGLIISELITNALQHAFENRDTGTISVTFEEQPEKYVLVVEDDGVGYEKGDDDDSMGQSLIEALAEGQLDGTLSFSNASEMGGTHCRLTFPKETNDSTESIPAESRYES